MRSMQEHDLGPSATRPDRNDETRQSFFWPWRLISTREGKNYADAALRDPYCGRERQSNIHINTAQPIASPVPCPPRRLGGIVLNLEMLARSCLNSASSLPRTLACVWLCGLT